MEEINHSILLSLRTEKSKIEKYVISNFVANFEDYKFCVGRIKGMNDSIEMILDILNKEE